MVKKYDHVNSFVGLATNIKNVYFKWAGMVTKYDHSNIFRLIAIMNNVCCQTYFFSSEAQKIMKLDCEYEAAQSYSGRRRIYARLELWLLGKKLIKWFTVVWDGFRE